MTTLLQKLRALAATEAKATKGPWEALSEGISGMHNETHSLHAQNGSLVSYGHLTKQDAFLIAESRNLLPALINLVEAQHEALERIRSVYGDGFEVDNIARAALALGNQEQP